MSNSRSMGRPGFPRSGRGMIAPQGFGALDNDMLADSFRAEQGSESNDFPQNERMHVILTAEPLENILCNMDLEEGTDVALKKEGDNLVEIMVATSSGRITIYQSVMTSNQDAAPAASPRSNFAPHR